MFCDDAGDDRSCLSPILLVDSFGFLGRTGPKADLARARPIRMAGEPTGEGPSGWIQQVELG
jgi:hypothetical protein